MMKPEIVLVVDDNEDDRYLAKLAFKDLGLHTKCFEARDGQEALEIINNPDHPVSEEGPDLIFLDINMPRMNGLEFLKEYEKYRSENNILKPSIVIMFTTSQNPTDMKAIESYSFVRDAIYKPIEEERLKALLEKIDE